MWGWLLCLAAILMAAEGAGAGAARLVCYVDSARATEGFSECTHLVYTGDARGEKLDALLKEYRKNNPRLKIVLRVADNDADLRSLLKSKHVQGLEIYDAHKTLNRTKISETVEEARAAVNSAGGGPLFLALPAHPELLAKYYDLRAFVKKADLMVVQTHALGKEKKTTYHPSRLSGMWDMMNTDSVVDLVVGLGVPASKVVITLPATALKFTLQNETLSTPGSPALEDEPTEISQPELCRMLQKGRWTLERDQDLSAPYAFKNTTWVSFEDFSSVDVKGKYARVRGLAGLGLTGADRDEATPCGATLKTALAKVLNQQSRAPRAAVLRSLENEILSGPGQARALDALQVSPYRITQVVDSDGVIHSIREDTRTEFTCSRQGYFVHPRSCARFYRCVKFDQLSPEYTVFEFDCPAGLAFDARVEVCVWPGSLPHASACPGSAEIAPVPQTRFVCPPQEGYYADPENCRWFFACIDHGKSPLSAYEFRCPFGLGFDAERLRCDWPWEVPACGHIGRYEASAHLSAATLTGAAGFQGQTADSINVAAHQSLVSGASLDNLVGVQNGFLSNVDALDSNFIASQEFIDGSHGAHSYQIGHDANSYAQNNNGVVYHTGESGGESIGLVQATKYDDGEKYTSGSLILDDYRYPTKKSNHGKAQSLVQSNLQQNAGQHSNSQTYLSGQSGNQYESGSNGEDQSGAYVHDPSGDYAEPYKHQHAPAVPYIHDDSGYKQSSDYYDYNRYSGASQSDYNGKYSEGNGKYIHHTEGNGQYVHDNSGSYVDSGSANGEYKDYSSSYIADNTGSYKHDDSGKYVAGVYRADGHIGSFATGSDYLGGENKDTYEGDLKQYNGAYSVSNSGNYLTDTKAYTGASHTLTAGAVNVGLVGKTTLIDAGYSDESNYDANGGYTFGSTVKHVSSHQTLHPSQGSYVSQPAVSIHHLGTDNNNLDGYGYVTTPTSSGVPTTATPFAVTTALPTISYKTTYITEPPKSDIKQIFGYQPAVTYVKQAIVPVVQHVTPKVEITDHNQGINTENTGYSYSQESSQSSGYNYPKPNVKFEDGISYTTPSPAISVSTYKPQGFSHSQQTIHKIESAGFEYSTPTPVNEPPFKKVVAYTTGPSYETYVQPTVASVPISFGHETIHKIETGNSYNEYVKPEIVVEPKLTVEYTTAQPAVVSSTYQPQVFSHQTIHQVDASKVNTYSHSSGEGYVYKEPELSGYEYEAPKIKFEEAPKTVIEYSTPAPVVSTYKPHSYSHQTIHKVEHKYVPAKAPAPVEIYSQSSSEGYVYKKPEVSGYEYEAPKIKFEEAPITVIEYSTPAPVVSTYKPHSYSHQTIHKVEHKYVPAPTPAPVEITYQQPSVTTYENPILTYAQKETPVEYVEKVQAPLTYSHQTIHKTYTPSYESSISYEAPKTIIQYTTPQPSIEIQPAVSTYEPHVISHQTLHNVDTSKVNTYSQEQSGYEYSKPSIKYEEGPKTVFQYSTPAPIADTTYKTHEYSHQTIHKVEAPKYEPVVSTVLPKIELSYQSPSVTVYENPLLKYTEKETYVQPAEAIYSTTYKPTVHQHEVTHISQPVQYEQTYSNTQFGQEGYTYSQPEIQRNNEQSAVKYSDASVVSHQVIHQEHVKTQPDKVVFVSSTPANLIYEDHYVDYEAPKKVAYKAPEYIPPKPEYQPSYSISSTASTPIVQHQSEVVHKYDSVNDYKSFENTQQYDTVSNVPIQHISFSTSHVSQPQGSVHVSTFPGTSVITDYKHVAQESPEVQVSYKAEEYLPPVQSTVTPIVSSTYKPVTYSTVSTSRDYLPPVSVAQFDINKYLPPKTTARPIVKSTTLEPTYKYVESTTQYKAPDYLPPLEDNYSEVIHYDSFGLKNTDDSSNYNSQYNSYQNNLPKQIVSSTYAPVQRKHNIVVETGKSNLLGFGTVGPDAGLVSSESYTTSAPVVSTTYRPVVKSTYRVPTYKYVESTTKYKAPEYLPPSEEYEYKNVDQSYLKNPYNSVQRKQNIVVETAKSQLLNYGAADAGQVSSVSYSTSTPVAGANKVKSAYYQESVSRRTKPKVAVVTKINDFNPFLVRKLGAVCSCQSPVVVLRGKRPNVQVQQDFDDYSNDYEDSGRGDISNNEWTRKSEHARAQAVKTTAPVSSTFNPIIVPDDSYYQDLQEYNYDSVPSRKEVYSESYVSSTPIVAPTTQKSVRVKSRVKAVTLAPTYETVLLNRKDSPYAEVKQQNTETSSVDSQAFDRYGPGGWRSREETLQGSVDCQRAGLFRHPKQCNKFYACRWDCTKQRFTLHVFNCPIQLSFDESLGACNWPSQGPACQGDTLLTNTL